jgi:hypothetical protein
VSRLAFLSPNRAYAVSPLRHVGSDAFCDVSALGKLELRGNVDSLDGVIPVGPGRALLVTDGDVREIGDRLSADGYRVYDMTGALAALEVEGEDLMRRLTELDLETLPAIGSIARGTPALIERRSGERFRVFVPQELGHYICEVIVDLARGLDR